jgi:chemotaxis family two-component system response regulator Rcp1
MSGKKIEILLVDDNRGDVILFREGLKEYKIDVNLSVAPDGIEGIAFLRQQGAYAGSPRPDLIFLDLNMPRKTGLEVLEEVKSDKDLKCIPVVIVTCNQDQETIRQAYDLHANCYTIKWVDFSKLNLLMEFWLTVAKLPSD